MIRPNAERFYNGLIYLFHIHKSFTYIFSYPEDTVPTYVYKIPFNLETLLG